MADWACQNPSCKSHGMPHPNCRCPAPMAEGGKASHYCTQDRQHLQACEYYAEGGQVPKFDDIPEAKSNIPKFDELPSTNSSSVPKFDELPNTGNQGIPSNEMQANEPEVNTSVADTKTDIEAAGRALTFGGTDALQKGVRHIAESLGSKDPNFWAPSSEDVSARAHTPEAKTVEGATNLIGMLSGSGAPGAIVKGAKALAPTALKESPVLLKLGSAAIRGGVEMGGLQTSDEISKGIMNDDPTNTVGHAMNNIKWSTVLGAGTGGLFNVLGQGVETGLNKLVKTKLADRARKMLAGAAVANTMKKFGIPVEKAEEFIKSSGNYHTEVDPGTFHNKIQEVVADKNPMYKANITPYSPEEYSGMKTYMHPDGKSGFAIKPDGELVSVFSQEKGRGAGLVSDAVLNKGASKLDAFDINGKLPDLYGKYMDETSRLKFADEYAPKDWDYSKMGRPDVVNMSINPSKVAEGLARDFKDLKPGIDAYNKVIDNTSGGIARGVGGSIGATVGGIAGGIAGSLGGSTGSIAGATSMGVAGERAGEKIGKMLFTPMVERIIDKPLNKANQYIYPAVVKCLTEGNTEGLFQAIDYAGKVSKGAKATYNGVDSLFKAGAQKAYEYDENQSLKEREALDKAVKDGGTNTQIQEENQVQPEEQYAEGGEVKPKIEDHFSTVFPNQAAALANAKSRIYNYLNQTRPQSPVDKLPFDSHREDPIKQKSYNRALDIANKPLSILNHIKDGTITPEHVQHMTQLHPEIYGDLTNKIMSKVVEHQSKGEKPSYKLRQGLSMFLGHPLEASMTPFNIQAAQSAFAPKQQPQQQQQAASKAKKGTAPLSKVSTNYMTKDQHREERQNKT